MRALLAALGLSLLTATPAFAAPCPANVSYPGEEWGDLTAETKASRANEIAELEKYLFTLQGEDSERKGVRTDGVLIVRGGSVVYEKYARGWDAKKRHLAWSVTKSLTDVLTGVAVKRGLLKVSDSICDHLAGLPAESCDITVQNLLQMASGQDWKEVYENESNQQSSVLAMLYGQGHADMGTFVGSHVRAHVPGTTWLYSTGDASLLARVVGNELAPREGDRWPWKVLFDPIGAKRVAFERDPKGGYTGGSYAYLTARDAARIGWLYRNDGCWNGQRLVPEGWVKESTSPNSAYLNARIAADSDDVYGRQWWLNAPVPHTQDKVPFPSAPADAFAARGHWGQSISVIPSLDLVIVRFGDDRETGITKFDELLRLGIAVGRAP